MRSPAFLVALFAAMVLGVAVQAGDTGRIYGKIHTVDGDVFEGLIRWDKNEGGWFDVLDGSKDRFDDDSRSRSSRRKYDRGRSTTRIFGIRIETDSDWDWSGTAQSGIRFGHLRSLEVLDDDRARLILKSGQEVELFNGSTDIGTGIREILIEDRNEGEIEFTWDDIDMIEFSETPGSLTSSFGERLYGTLTTRRGQEFTGFVCWDMDELYDTDILDGDEDRRSRKIKFGQIASISRYSSSGAEVKLKDGDEILLRNSNDIDSGNRGIVISDMALGQVNVPWDEFETLVFEQAPKAAAYGDFDGGFALEGTVYTEDGKEYTGRIIWDDDEAYSWEILDGEYRDVQFDLELGLIKEIEKATGRGCDVTVSDGRQFTLKGSNDVDEDNKGIIIKQGDGDEVFIDWEDFERVVFKGR